MRFRGRISDMRKSNGESIPIEISIDEFRKTFDTDAILIDCRVAVEYEASHLESSKLLPLQQLSVRSHELEQFQHSSIYIYCRTGNRSCTFARYLRTIGFTKCQSIAGGFDEWGEGE